MYTSMVRLSRRLVVRLILLLIPVLALARLHLWKCWIRLREDADRGYRGWS